MSYPQIPPQNGSNQPGYPNQLRPNHEQPLNRQVFMPPNSGGLPNILTPQFTGQISAPKVPTSALDQDFRTTTPVQPTPDFTNGIYEGRTTLATGSSQIRPLAQVYAPSATVGSAVEASSKKKPKPASLKPLLFSAPFILILLLVGIFYITLWGMSMHATRQYNAKDYAAAANNFSYQQAMASSWPQSWLPRYNQGTSLLQAAQLDKGVNLLEQALKLVPPSMRDGDGKIMEPNGPECKVRLNLSTGYIALGDELMKEKEFAKAEEKYGEAQKTLDPCTSGGNSGDQQDQQNQQGQGGQDQQDQQNQQDQQQQADQKDKEATDKKRESQKQQGKEPEPEQQNQQDQSQNQDQKSDSDQSQDPAEQERRKELEKRNQKSREEQQNDQDRQSGGGIGGGSGRNW